MTGPMGSSRKWSWAIASPNSATCWTQLALFVNFLVIMIGHGATCLQTDDTFSKIWHAWLGIFLVGLVVEVTSSRVHFCCFQSRTLVSSKWFASKFATIIINWYVRSSGCPVLHLLPHGHSRGHRVRISQQSNGYEDQLARLARTSR